MTLGHQGHDEAEDDKRQHLTPLERELLDALYAALDFIEDQEDVRDGADGQQLPNTAMVLACHLRRVIAKATGGEQ